MTKLCPFRKASSVLTVNVMTDYALWDGEPCHKDNSTDDHDHLQAAIDYVSGEGGGIVYLPAGTYKVNGSHSVPPGVNGYHVLIKDGVHIKGAGEDQTYINASGLANMSALLSYQATNIAASYMTIYNVGDAADAIKFCCSSGVSISRVTAHDCVYSGIAAEGCNRVVVNDCLAYTCGVIGISVPAYATDVKTPENTYGDDLTITDCEAYDCVQGFNAAGNATKGITNVTLTNLYAHDNVDGAWPKGIYVALCTGLTMTNCRAWVTGTGANGNNVDVGTTTNGTISGTGYKNPGGTSAYLHANTNVTESGAHEDS